MNNLNIAEAVRLAQGARTQREYAQAAGVDAATLSRILAGKTVPTLNTIKKLTDDSAGPQNGVTYEELLAAAGCLRATGKEGNEIKNTDIVRAMAKAVIVNALDKDNVKFTVVDIPDEGIPSGVEQPDFVFRCSDGTERWFYLIQGNDQPTGRLLSYANAFLFEHREQIKITLMTSNKQIAGEITEIKRNLLRSEDFDMLWIG